MENVTGCEWTYREVHDIDGAAKRILCSALVDGIPIYSNSYPEVSDLIFPTETSFVIF